MYKIVTHITPPQQMTVDEALERQRAGLIVQVHSGRVSVLVDGAHNNTIAGGRCAGLYRLGENYYGRWSTQSPTEKEVLERALGGSGEIFYFETLAEFAQAVLAEGWR